MSTAAPSARDAATDDGVVRTPVRRHRRRSVVLLALAVFQFWLWGTRINNLVRDAGEFSTAFVAVHGVLYTAAIGAGIVLAVLGLRMWREARVAGDRS
ncbi:hypothetical protein [Egicoccus sp. AB-alg6-2]|uniref:hypothetical protein n=1 Tax=Egicoccus sp. AB-alg6-2 TaxID=3242692 RepID=UPI00359DAA2B